MSGEELRAAVKAFIEDHDDGRLGPTTPLWCDGKCAPLDRVRTALAAPSTPEPSGLACGARAVGGSCVLPKGHNMGYADVPERHRASRETRWAFLDTETGEWIEVVPGTVALLAAPSTPEPTDLATIVSDSLAATTMGTDYAEAPEPSDEPGSPYVMRLTNEIASRLRAAPSTLEPSGVYVKDEGYWAGYRAAQAERAAPSIEPALDVNAMADALHFTAVRNHNVGEGPMRAICHSAESHRSRAEAVLARLAESR